jgi:hypothetical protein
MPSKIGTHVLLPKDTKAIPLMCDECGASIQLVIPISITNLMLVANAFDNAHAECVLDRKERE